MERNIEKPSGYNTGMIPSDKEWKGMLNQRVLSHSPALSKVYQGHHGVDCLPGVGLLSAPWGGYWQEGIDGFFF